MYRLTICALWFSFLVAGAAGAQSPAAAKVPEREFSFAKLNRTYSDLVSDLAPIEHGPLTLRLSSPSHSLVVKRNRVRLRPAGESVHAGRLELEILGKGWLIADIEGAGLATRLQDELYVPPQTIVVDGKVRMTRGDGGYRVTAIELPGRVRVRIQSKLSNQLLGWCDGLSFLMRLDCDGLGRALSTAAVPMPPPGGDYFLADTELTADDRTELDNYLAKPPAAAGRVE